LTNLISFDAPGVDGSKMPNPSHDDLAQYLRCVVYDLHVLALATEAMIKEKDPGQSEVNKTAALIKLRAVYDLFPSAEGEGFDQGSDV
jgi:hypothetical protein